MPSNDTASDCRHPTNELFAGTPLTIRNGRVARSFPSSSPIGKALLGRAGLTNECRCRSWRKCIFGETARALSLTHSRLESLGSQSMLSPREKESERRRRTRALERERESERRRARVAHACFIARLSFLFRSTARLPAAAVW